MIYQGDCLEVIKRLISEGVQVDAVVTDPPYGLSFMGKKWDISVPSVEIWEACFELLKPGGYLLAFAGTRTQHRMACNIEDAGFEIRDMLAWIYGSGFPKNHNIGKILGDPWEGWGTALKPSLEPITMARKPFKGTIADNVLLHGTGGINVDGCRVGSENLSSQWDRKWNENGTFGNGKRDSLKKTSIGRYPANLIHDGSEEVKAVFPDDNSRFFYCAKASRAEREEGLVGNKTTVSDGRAIPIDNAYQRGTTERLNTHPTVKPIALMRYLCRLVTQPGGTVLDPFLGSGTTGIAAVQEGFEFIGIERDPAHFDLASRRIKYHSDKIEGIETPNEEKDKYENLTLF